MTFGLWEKCLSAMKYPFDENNLNERILIGLHILVLGNAMNTVDYPA